MEIKVLRYSDNGESTLGLVFIDGEFQCYSIEDEERTKKVWGETRIPEGRYEVKLRTEGGHHIRYSKRFGAVHKGMLHVTDVPNFQYILIHIGNDDDDTAGCLLVGNVANNNNLENGFIQGSTTAYLQLYEKVSDAIIHGEQVHISYERVLG